MSAFNVGDVVQLKSGGPRMTIEKIGNFGPLGPSTGARCVWFVNSSRQEAVFDVDTLAIPSAPGPLTVTRA